ncbi:hypothetical protein DSM112329_02307 [Paraconexibacter sp. AEG42_29]|uniref:Resuscitation-promoting factor core lysozyme-like domain-containing protein n=1 Tax=Paraconexibacter sp. AEG42_29 TaxID=2997339 RepID=A0AAU7AUY3_9ACTN
MTILAPRARRVVALAGLTAAVATPAGVALTAAGPAEAGQAPALLSPAALAAPISTAAVVDLHLAEHRRALRHDRAVLSTFRTARNAARVRGDELPRGYRAKLERRSVAHLKTKQRRLRRQVREWRSTGGAPDVPIPAHLAAIAACESGGDPAAIGGGGTYRGKYQFSYATWATVGGQGDPAAAPEAEQDRRAAMLYAQAGAGQWPVCGR